MQGCCEGWEMKDLLRIPFRNLLCISLRNLCIPLRILWECKVSLLSKSRHILFLLDQLCCDWAGCPLHLRGELPRRKSYHLPRVNISSTGFPKCFFQKLFNTISSKKKLFVVRKFQFLKKKHGNDFAKKNMLSCRVFISYRDFSLKLFLLRRSVQVLPVMTDLCSVACPGGGVKTPTPREIP